MIRVAMIRVAVILRRLRLTALAPLLLGLPIAAGCSASAAKRNHALDGLAPELPVGALEVVAELPQPPGNLGVAAGGRVFFTFHPEAKPPAGIPKLAQLLPDGSIAAFPDASWQQEREDGPYFVTPLAVRVDARGRVWVLDHGDYGEETPSLTAFDPETRAVVHRFEFPDEAAGWGSMLNDFDVDAERDVVYLADTSAFAFDQALVVYDVAARSARRVLEDHESVEPEDQHAVVQGRFMKAFGLALQLGVDTIALSPDRAWLAYGPLSGGRMWRVPTEALRDPSLDEEALAAQVEALGPKPTSDGGVFGPDGRLFLTAVEHDAIAVLRPDGRLGVLVQDAELLAWPDGLAVSPDGAWLYAAVSELHRVIGRDLDDLPEHRPFRIVRVRIGEAPEASPPTAPSTAPSTAPASPR